MMNSGPDPTPDMESQDAAVNGVVLAGARGAIVLAGIATAIVVALWFAFYVLVFMPRATVL